MDPVQVTRDAVDLLERFAPGKLERLRIDMPDDLRPELHRGGICGHADLFLPERVRITYEALTTVVGQCQIGTQRMARRIQWVGWLRVASAVITVVGSSSVVVMAARQSYSWTIAAGVITLIGAISSALEEQLLKYPIAGHERVFAVHLDLTRQLSKGEALLRTLRPFLNVRQMTKEEQRAAILELKRASSFLEAVNVHRYLVQSVVNVECEKEPAV